VVHNERTRRITEILAITDHDDIEADRNFKYLGTLSKNTHDVSEEIKARITAANHSIFPSEHYM